MSCPKTVVILQYRVQCINSLLNLICIVPSKNIVQACDQPVSCSTLALLTHRLESPIVVLVYSTRPCLWRRCVVTRVCVYTRTAAATLLTVPNSVRTETESVHSQHSLHSHAVQSGAEAGGNATIRCRCSAWGASTNSSHKRANRCESEGVNVQLRVRGRVIL